MKSRVDRYYGPVIVLPPFFFSCPGANSEALLRRQMKNPFLPPLKAEEQDTRYQKS